MNSTKESFSTKDELRKSNPSEIFYSKDKPNVIKHQDETLDMENKTSVSGEQHAASPSKTQSAEESTISNVERCVTNNTFIVPKYCHRLPLTLINQKSKTHINTAQEETTKENLDEQTYALKLPFQKNVNLQDNKIIYASKQLVKRIENKNMEYSGVSVKAEKESQGKLMQKQKIEFLELKHLLEFDLSKPSTDFAGQQMINPSSALKERLNDEDAQSEDASISETCALTITENKSTGWIDEINPDELKNEDISENSHSYFEIPISFPRQNITKENLCDEAYVLIDEIMNNSDEELKTDDVFEIPHGYPKIPIDDIIADELKNEDTFENPHSHPKIPISFQRQNLTKENVCEETYLILLHIVSQHNNETDCACTKPVKRIENKNIESLKAPVKEKKRYQGQRKKKRKNRFLDLKYIFDFKFSKPITDFAARQMINPSSALKEVLNDEEIQSESAFSSESYTLTTTQKIDKSTNSTDEINADHLKNEDIFQSPRGYPKIRMDEINDDDLTNEYVFENARGYPKIRMDEISNDDLTSEYVFENPRDYSKIWMDEINADDLTNEDVFENPRRYPTIQMDEINADDLTREYVFENPRDYPKIWMDEINANDLTNEDVFEYPLNYPKIPIFYPRQNLKKQNLYEEACVMRIPFQKKFNIAPQHKRIPIVLQLWPNLLSDFKQQISSNKDQACAQLTNILEVDLNIDILTHDNIFQMIMIEKVKSRRETIQNIDILQVVKLVLSGNETMAAFCLKVIEHVNKAQEKSNFINIPSSIPECVIHERLYSDFMCTVSRSYDYFTSEICRLFDSTDNVKILLSDAVFRDLMKFTVKNPQNHFDNEWILTVAKSLIGTFSLQSDNVSFNISSDQSSTMHATSEVDDTVLITILPDSERHFSLISEPSSTKIKPETSKDSEIDKTQISRPSSEKDAFLNTHNIRHFTNHSTSLVEKNTWVTSILPLQAAAVTPDNASTPLSGNSKINHHIKQMTTINNTNSGDLSKLSVNIDVSKLKKELISVFENFYSKDLELHNKIDDTSTNPIKRTENKNIKKIQSDRLSNYKSRTLAATQQIVKSSDSPNDINADDLKNEYIFENTRSYPKIISSPRQNLNPKTMFKGKATKPVRKSSKGETKPLPLSEINIYNAKEENILEVPNTCESMPVPQVSQNKCLTSSEADSSSHIEVKPNPKISFDYKNTSDVVLTEIASNFSRYISQKIEENNSEILKIMKRKHIPNEQNKSKSDKYNKAFPEFYSQGPTNFKETNEFDSSKQSRPQSKNKSKASGKIHTIKELSSLKEFSRCFNLTEKADTENFPEQRVGASEEYLKESYEKGHEKNKNQKKNKKTKWKKIF